MSDIKNNYKDDPEARVLNMELVLDEAETKIVNGVNELVDSLITPLLQRKVYVANIEYVSLLFSISIGSIIY